MNKMKFEFISVIHIRIIRGGKKTENNIGPKPDDEFIPFEFIPVTHIRIIHDGKKTENNTGIQT